MANLSSGNSFKATKKKKKPVAVTFIVPLFNHLRETRVMWKTLEASLPAGISYELIFVNDASTDGTAKWLAGHRDSRIRIITNRTNLGYAKSNNKAAKAAKGTLLCLLNNDLVFGPGWLEPMLEILKDKALGVGIVGNVQYRVADGSLDHAGVALTPLGKIEHIQKLADDCPTRMQVKAVTGACLLIRKSDFAAAKGFDETFVNGGEDVDLCFAVGAAGKSVYLATSSRIHHHVGLSRGSTSAQAEHNSRYLLRKWRRVLMQMLASCWLKLLKADPAARSAMLQGTLTGEFLATPRAAASVIAEFLLQREELRWQRELDGVDANQDVANRCTAYGLQFDVVRKWYVASSEFGFAVRGLKSARNFYVCGVWRQPVLLLGEEIAMTISVNGIQEQSFVIDRNYNINVGIIDPIVLPHKINQFRIGVHKLAKSGKRLCDASEYIAVTHIVVDDRVINLH